MLARQIRRLRPGLVLLQHPDDLIFREPRSLHLSVLQEARTLNPRGGKSQRQVSGGKSRGWRITTIAPRSQVSKDAIRCCGYASAHRQNLSSNSAASEGGFGEKSSARTMPTALRRCMPPGLRWKQQV